MLASTTILLQSSVHNLPAKVCIDLETFFTFLIRPPQVLCSTDYLARTLTSWTRLDDNRRPRVSLMPNPLRACAHAHPRDALSTVHMFLWDRLDARGLVPHVDLWPRGIVCGKTFTLGFNIRPPAMTAANASQCFYTHSFVTGKG